MKVTVAIHSTYSITFISLSCVFARLLLVLFLGKVQLFYAGDNMVSACHTRIRYPLYGLYYYVYIIFKFVTIGTTHKARADMRQLHGIGYM